MTPEIAEILGAFIGDGWIESRGNALYIMGDPSEDKDYYDNFLGPLFSKNFSNIELKMMNSWGTYGIVCYDKK